MRPLLVPILVACAAPLALAQHALPAEKGPRAELRALEAALARAADAVARPGVFALQSGACRGYRIEGVGAVFVLPARAVRGQGQLVRQRTDARVGRRVRAVPHSELDREIQVVEQQAEALQREAARTHQEVERAIAEVQWEIQRRHPEQPTAPAPPEAPSPPEPPAAPEPPIPPWTLWFDAGLEDEASEAPAATVVARMRTALVDALSTHGGTLRALRPEETIAAAVDFVPGFPFGVAKVERTLVVRIRKRDLDERKAGRIGPDELKARVEVAEY
ncbi:MAG TPA: hypothetical protein VFM88_09125 [Vicinamibacteria bacterium]|nr:hypothetical protein [Vicinamibacteria bacterium]